MKQKTKSEEIYAQKALFYNESIKEYVPVSDGAELLVYYTKKGKNPLGLTIFFVPGFATGPFSWNDLWDCLYEEFDLYVIEKRELKSSKVKWKHKANMDRLAEDVENVIEHYNLDPKKTVLMGTCLGTSIIGRILARKRMTFASAVMMNPPRHFFLPKALLPLGYICPAFTMAIIGKPLIKTWLKLSMPSGNQRETYLENISNANGMRWKKFMAITKWDSFDDYAKIKMPVLVVATTKDKIHEAKIAQQATELMENATFLDAPSYYWMHFHPTAEIFTKKVIEYLEKLK